MKDTLVIMGHYDDGTKTEFNWKRQDCDLWVFNEAAGKTDWLMWCTAVFQMHLPAVFRNPLNRNDNGHYQWLKENTAFPVYMIDQYPEIPMAVKYPVDEIVATLLPNWERPKNELWDDRGDYSTSTLCYMLALAIYQGYKRVELWGIGLAKGTEYFQQRPGVFFWNGYALGHGVNIAIHSHMFDAPLYGYQDVFIPIESFEKRKLDIEKMLDAVNNQFISNRAAMVTAIMQFKMGQIDGRRFQGVTNDYIECLKGLAQLRGSQAEVDRYINKAKKMMAESGDNDFRFTRQEFEDSRIEYKKQASELAEARASRRVEVEAAWKAIENAPKRKRHSVINRFVRLFDADNELIARLNELDARANENLQNMRIMDKQSSGSS